MRSCPLGLVLACTAGLASCATVTRDSENGTSPHVAAIDAGSTFAWSDHRFAGDFRFEGGDSRWDESGFLFSVSPSGGRRFSFRDVVLNAPWLAANGIKHPFKCRITPIAASTSQRRWRIFPCENGLSLLMVAGVGESGAPISLLVSGYEPDLKYLSDYQGLPKVQVLEILNGEVAEKFESAVRSAQNRWEYTDVLFVLLVPGLLLMAVLAIARLMPLARARGALWRRAAEV